jgi:hypothetical protein
MLHSLHFDVVLQRIRTAQGCDSINTMLQKNPIILVGDEAQLPCVCNSNRCTRIAGVCTSHHIATSAFFARAYQERKCYNLTTVHRNEQFAATLNHIRNACLTSPLTQEWVDEHINTLPITPTPPADAHILCTHVTSANAHNDRILQQKHQDIVPVDFATVQRERERGAVIRTVSREDLTPTKRRAIYGNNDKHDLLPRIAKNCPVRITHNYDKARGAVNGAVGTITHWNTRVCHGTSRVTGIYVKLDINPEPIRIGRLEAKTQSIEGRAFSWAPFGLALNYASTIHAAQGNAIHGTVYIDLGSVFEYGLLHICSPVTCYIRRPSHA